MTHSIDCDIQHHFKSSHFQLTAQFSINKPAIVGIFGDSGSGKTSLLRCIAGLQPCEHAHIRVKEAIWQNDTINLPTYQRKLGMVFQQASLLPHLSVRQNIEYGYKRIPAHSRLIEPDAAIEALGLQNLLTHGVHELSGGQQQRVALARAVLLNPDVLLMDEPLSGLDEISKSILLRYVRQLHEQHDISILYVSHSPDEIAQIADELLIMQQGQLTTQGRVDELFTSLGSPLTQRKNAEAIIHAKVTHYDAAYDLLTVSTGAMQLRLTHAPLDLNTSVRIRILARDVSIALQQSPDSSILNCIPVTISDMQHEPQSSVLLKLTTSDTTLLCRITKKSADHLALKQGMSVFAQVKSMALLN